MNELIKIESHHENIYNKAEIQILFTNSCSIKSNEVIGRMLDGNRYVLYFLTFKGNFYLKILVEKRDDESVIKILLNDFKELS